MYSWWQSAHSRRDAEAQALALVRQPEGRVEAAADQEPGAGGASIPSCGHAAMLREVPSRLHDPSVPRPPRTPAE
jgi:hypothetical protein